MADEQRSKEDLINELNELRRRITELELGLSGVHPFIMPTSGDESVKKNGRRKDVEQSENEARFRSVLESTQDVIYRLNLHTGRYEFISPSVEVMLGYSPEELMSMDVEVIHSMAHPDDQLAISEVMVRQEENGAGEFIYRQRTKAGDYRWLSNRMTLTRDRAGRPLYRDGNIRDITESKRAEEALRASEDRYQSLVNLSPDAILVHSGGKYIFANPAALTLFGAGSPEEIVGREVLDLVHPDQRQAARGRIERAFNDNLTALTETKLIRLDGKPVDVELTGVGIEFGGNPARQIVVRDITERKKTEGKLKESEQHLKDILSSIQPTFRMKEIPSGCFNTESVISGFDKVF